MKYNKAKTEGKKRDKILNISRPRIRQKEDRKYGIIKGQERGKKEDGK